MSIASILKTSVGFRCLENVLKIQNMIDPESSFSAPTYGSIRSWILRYGLYKLNQPVEQADDWIFIQDHSSQVGDDKIHVILGIRLSTLNEVGFQPTLDDVEVLVVRPVKSSRGEIVCEALEEARMKIGKSPLQIIGDGGSDGRRGAKLFLENNPKCVLSYDIAHKLDIFLKDDLKDDPDWASFKENATQTMQKAKLSKISHIVPPPQRSKGRLFSEFAILKWGCDLHKYYNRKQYDGVEASFVKEKIGWINGYKKHLTLYNELVSVSTEAKQQIGGYGYQRNSARVFAKRLRCLKLSKRARDFGNEICSFLEEEGAKIPPEHAYLGSDEVIESLFGKFKHIEDNHASRGFGSSVLAIPALVGELSEDSVHAAMEEVRASSVSDWVKRYFGTTFLSRRRTAFSEPQKTEQNRDENNVDSTGGSSRKRLKNSLARFLEKIKNPFRRALEAC